MRGGTTHPRAHMTTRHRPMVQPAASGVGTHSAHSHGSAGTPPATTREVYIVDKDRVEGPLKEAGGKIKEAWGDATDNTETEAEGKKDQAEGELQQDWGKIKDKARDLADHD